MADDHVLGAHINSMYAYACDCDTGERRLLNATGDHELLVANKNPLGVDIVAQSVGDLTVDINAQSGDPLEVVVTTPPAADTNLSKQGSVLVADTATQLCPANDDRRYLIMINSGFNVVYIGNANVTAAPQGNTTNGGLPIPPGGGIVFDPGEDNSSFFGICLPGLTSTIVRREVSNA